MKRIQKFLALGLMIVLFLTGTGLVTAEEPDAIKSGAAKEVSVAFTHDIHSHLEPFYTYFEEEEVQIGGLSRISTLLQELRAEDEDLLLLDGGDFSMGTLYQLLYAKEAAELRMLGMLGYDATTMGNHEFDYGSSGLASMLNSAVDSQESLPALVLCNVDWTEPLNEEQALLKEAFERYGVADYTVVTKGDVRIAITGVMGVDALECAPTCALTMEDPIEAVKETVAEIRSREDVDMIVCVSHGGVTDDPDTSEDEKMAQEVPELDLIVSGHSHKRLDTLIVYGDTAVVSCGEYGEYLGSLKMQQNAQGRWDIAEYELTPVTAEIPEDSAVTAALTEYEALIDASLMKDYGFGANTVLAHNPYDFGSAQLLTEVNGEYALANLITDAFHYAGEELAVNEGAGDVAVAVIPSGCVRDGIVQGEVTVAEVFEAYSLGIGPDGKMGYPLIGVYLTGEELEVAAEIDISISELMTSARVYSSGISYVYNPNRVILNKVVDVKLVPQSSRPYVPEADVMKEELVKDQMYYVVADLYTGQMLSAVEDMSFGLLAVTPKDAAGNPITDLNTAILYDEKGNEIKAWTAIVSYFQTFEEETGKAEVPDYYSQTQNRKICEDSRNLIDLLKNPSRLFVLFTLAIVVVIVVIGLVITLIVKRRKRKKIRKAQELCAIEEEKQKTES